MKHSTDEEGSVLVEFALSLFVSLIAVALFTFILIALYRYLAVQHAIQIGGRIASVRAVGTAGVSRVAIIQDVVTRRARLYGVQLQTDDVSICPAKEAKDFSSCLASDAGDGDTFIVITANVPILLPFRNGLFRVRTLIRNEPF